MKATYDNNAEAHEPKALIFDIQRYALYDGPGIRTTVFFKGCPLRCAWCHNPESQSPKKEISYFAEKCVACGACARACVSGALKVKKKLGVVRDNEKCVVCGACASACEAGATELIGKEATVSEIADAIESDRPFYEESGGGATISGGEPTAQPAFLFALLAELKSRGIHTAVETCGRFNANLAPRLAALADLILFDVKHGDPDAHEKLVGASLKPIAENFAELLKLKGEGGVVARVPLIPGANTDEESINGVIEMLNSNGYSGGVHLMPYNRLAFTKWQKIGRGREYRDFGALDDAVISRIESQFHAVGLKTFINR